MNKAFTKEPEQAGGICPRCGSAGSAVGPETLEVFVRAERLPDIAKPAYFCGFPHCDVVYFDDFERVILTGEVVRPVWPKDSEAPLCGCFGFHAADVAADVAAGGVAATREAVARAKSPEARCLTMAADGRSCAPEIQRLYFKLKSGEKR
jgi:hypothetical protein